MFLKRREHLLAGNVELLSSSARGRSEVVDWERGLWASLLQQGEASLPPSLSQLVVLVGGCIVPSDSFLLLSGLRSGYRPCVFGAAV